MYMCGTGVLHRTQNTMLKTMGFVGADALEWGSMYGIQTPMHEQCGKESDCVKYAVAQTLYE